MQSLTQQDVVNVLTCLQGALSSNPDVQKQAENYLSGIEKTPGFCSCLAEIIADKDADHSARWLASVHFKNSITRNWRPKPDQQSISTEEKAHLRSKLPSLIAQDDNQIAVQIALVFARVARVDYPRDWPSLFQDLLGLCQAGSSNGGSNSGSSSPLVVRRSYLVLHHVLKELSSKRLLADQKSFAEIAQFLFSYIWGQWCVDTQQLLAGLPAGLESAQAGQPLLHTFERWLLLLKILRRCILFGHPSDARSLQPVAAVSACAPAMVQALQQMVGLRPGGRRAGAAGGGPPPRSHLGAMLDRGVLKLLKTQCQVQEMHPWSYHAAGTLLPLLEFCCGQLVGAEEQGVVFDKFLVQCCCFVINVMTCGPYKGKAAAVTPSGQAAQADAVRALASQLQAGLASFWSPERLAALASATITKYMTLKARDLDEWESSPEEFYHAGDISAWQEQLHMAAENLYQTLLGAFREQLAPVVVGMLQQASSACPTGADLAGMPGERVEGYPLALLRKEAVYNAVALGAYDLHDYVDYTAWLRGSLMQELGNAQPLNKPLRRRVAKLVAAWVPRLAQEDRPGVYRSLLSLLSEEDLCLRLSAVDALRCLVDDFNFVDSQLAEVVGPLMGLLLGLLGASSELDTQTQAFNLMNLVIERLGEAIRPFVEAIMGMLPGLWRDAQGQGLLRIQVLLAMQRLVHVLGPESTRAYPIVVPLLQESLDPRSPDSLVLLEDGLGLWLVALRHAPDPQPQLLQLLPLLSSAMSVSTEHISAGMAVLTSCLLMGGVGLVQQAHQELVSMLGGFLGNVNERGMLLLFGPLALALQLGADVAGPLLQPCLVKLLALLLGGAESSLTKANALPVFARLLLHSPQAFAALCASAAAQGVGQGLAPPKESLPADITPGEVVLCQLLDVWLEEADGLASPRSARLCALALAQLLGLPSRAPLAYLDQLLAAITGVWFQQEGGGEGERVGFGLDYSSTLNPGGLAGGDELDMGMPEGPTTAVDSEDAEGEIARRRALCESDPVLHQGLGAALRDRLAACAALHGPLFQAAMARLDPTMAAQLNTCLQSAAAGQAGAGQ